MKLELFLLYMIAMPGVLGVCPTASSYWTLKNHPGVSYNVDTFPTPIRMSFIKGPSAANPNKCEHKFTKYSSDGCFSQTSIYTGDYNTGDKYQDEASGKGWLLLRQDIWDGKGNIVWLNNVKCIARRPQYQAQFLQKNTGFISYRFVSKTQLHLVDFALCLDCPGAILKLALTKDYYSQMKVVWKDNQSSPAPPRPVINNVNPPARTE